MGKRAKSSRKGKKAWRANISTEDIVDFYEKSTKDALSGGSLSVFCRDLSVKRKIEKRREKVLRCDSILQKNTFVQPVPSSTLKKSKKKLKEIQIAKETDENAGKDGGGMTDLWDDKGEHVKSKKMSKPSIIPAVEIDPSGCSFNPSSDSHQVVFQILLCEVCFLTQPVPLTVPGEAINEEDMYFLDADINVTVDDDGLDGNLDKDGDTEVENN